MGLLVQGTFHVRRGYAHDLDGSNDWEGVYGEHHCHPQIHLED